MKRALSVIVLSLLIGGNLSTPSAALEPAEFVEKLFFSLCLQHLPTYQGANLALEAAGYEPVMFGDNEYEFSHASNGVWGAFQITQGNAPNGGCSIFHESLSEIDTQQIGLSVAKQFSDVEPRIWKYEGVPSGWTVPYKGRVLYIIYNEGGISSDIRDK